MKKHPWIWLALAHITVVAGLAVVAYIAHKNAPQEIPLRHDP